MVVLSEVDFLAMDLVGNMLLEELVFGCLEILAEGLRCICDGLRVHVLDK
jgi:hypothetical protein